MKVIIKIEEADQSGLRVWDQFSKKLRSRTIPPMDVIRLSMDEVNLNDQGCEIELSSSQRCPGEIVAQVDPSPILQLKYRPA